MSPEQPIVDLHMHTFLSDGELLPTELVQRCVAAGYGVMALTDHADSSNLDFLVEAACRVADDFNSMTDPVIRVVPGVELTHVIPAMIGRLADRARSLGACLVMVHGETIVEPVPRGTNRAAIEAGVDMLAHPGLITGDEVELAHDRGVVLELTTRRGHSTANGHVARLAREAGAAMVLNSDAHSPGDILTPVLRQQTILGAGLDEGFPEKLAAHSLKLFDRIMGKEKT